MAARRKYSRHLAFCHGHFSRKFFDVSRQTAEVESTVIFISSRHFSFLDVSPTRKLYRESFSHLSRFKLPLSFINSFSPGELFSILFLKSLAVFLFPNPKQKPHINQRHAPWPMPPTADADTDAARHEYLSLVQNVGCRIVNYRRPLPRNRYSEDYLQYF